MKLGTKHTPWLAILTLASVFLGTGSACLVKGKPTSPYPPAQPPQGTNIPDATVLKPDALPYAEAALIVGGTTIPIEMARVESKDQVSLKLLVRGRAFEEEVYRLGPKEFSLVSALGESYRPSIPLLRFPMVAGESWKWEGESVFADQGRKASAEIRTMDDTLNLRAGQFQTVNVTVDLYLDSGAAEPAKRTLKFWFSKDRGIIRREFGFSSTREPRAKEPE